MLGAVFLFVLCDRMHMVDSFGSEGSSAAWIRHRAHQVREQRARSTSFKHTVFTSARLLVAAVVLLLLLAIYNVHAMLYHAVVRIPSHALWLLSTLRSRQVERLRPATVQEELHTARVFSKYGRKCAPSTSPTLVNTHGFIERTNRFLPQSEIQMIYNLRCAMSVPPFSNGARYDAPLWNAHVSTIIANLRPIVPNVYHRETFKSYDGCTLCLDWAFATSGVRCNADVKGIVLVVPGLASSSRTTYIQVFVRHVIRSRYHCAVINARGMGDTPLDVPRSVDGVNTNDLRSTVDFMNPQRLHEELGIPSSTPLFVVGHSLGASLLSKFLGEEGRKRADEREQECKLSGEAEQNDPMATRSTIAGAVAVCCPWDFHATHHFMMRPIAKVIYQQHLVDGIIEYLENHIDTFRRMADFDIDVLVKGGIRKVQDYDSHITTPKLGFESIEDYYSAAQPRGFLSSIDVPTMALVAKDDPITGPPPKDAFWENMVLRNPNICFVGIPAGGHLAFLQGVKREISGDANPMEIACTDFFDQLLQASKM